jgi:hypothetical protein
MPALSGITESQKSQSQDWEYEKQRFSAKNE